MDAKAAASTRRTSSATLSRQANHKSFRDQRRNRSMSEEDLSEEDEEDAVELSRAQSRLARRRSFRG